MSPCRRKMHHEKFISTSKQLLKLLKRLKFLRAMGPSRPQGFACSVAPGRRPILHHPGPDEMVGLPRPRFKTVCEQHPPSLRSGSDFLKKSKMNRGRAKRGNWAPQRSWEASKLSSSKGRRPQPRSKSSEDAYHHPEFGPASMNKCAVPSHSTKSPASTASGPMKVMP